jgi:MFS family permease
MDKSAISVSKRPAGMTGFIIVWIGQIISIMASGMSGFGLSIWMFEQTKSATAMGLMQVFYILPFLLLSPIAGVMVDRYNRKLMMMVSDFTAVMATLRSSSCKPLVICNSGISTLPIYFTVWATPSNGRLILRPSAQWSRKSNTDEQMD